MQRLNELLERAKAHTMSAEERDEQRRNFAFGNATISNPRITRATVDHAAAALLKRQ